MFYVYNYINDIANQIKITRRYNFGRSKALSLSFRFNHHVIQSLNLANRGAKYLPYIRTSVSISKELEMFQKSIFQHASTKLETLQAKHTETNEHLKRLHDRMEVLTVELNLEIKNLLNGIEELVRNVFKDELESLAVLVSGFEAQFYNDQAVLNLYKQHLIRYEFVLVQYQNFWVFEIGSYIVKQNSK